MTQVLIQRFHLNFNRNKVIVEVTVGDSKPLKIILDTGMSMEGLLLYNKELKESLKLVDPMEVKVPGAGKGEPSTTSMIHYT